MKKLLPTSLVKCKNKSFADYDANPNAAGLGIYIGDGAVYWFASQTIWRYYNRNELIILS